jgi:hypothetical protein
MHSFEKRHFIRAKVDFPVIVDREGSDGGQWILRAVDISADGIHFLAEKDLALDAVLLLHFPPEWGSVSVIAKVVRREGNHYGCQFFDIPESVRHNMDEAIYRAWRLSVPETLKDL